MHIFAIIINSKMRIGIPEYELTYLGEPVSMEHEGSGTDNSHKDFSIWIANIVSFNIEKKFTTSIIDVSEFEFISDIFNSYLNTEEINYNEILFTSIRENIEKTHHRVFFYIPKDYFLGSIQPEIIKTTICGITNINYILGLLCDNGGIIVRVGSAYGNRKNTMLRFATGYESLPANVKCNLLLVNDDRPSLFSVKDLLTELSIPYKIPIVFRTLGHYFNPGLLTYKDALSLSLSTWHKNKLPLIIHTESINFNQNGIPESRVISNHLTKRIPTFNKNICVVIESNYKELSCYRYINEYKVLKPVIIDRIK